MIKEKKIKVAVQMDKLYKMSSENLYSYEVFNFNFLSSNLQLPDLKKVKNAIRNAI